MVRYIFPLVIFMGLAGFLWLGLSLKPNELPSQLINKPAPTFVLPTLSAPDTKITESIFVDKISLVNVWSSWCLYCKHEHQFLLDLKNSSNLQILGLNYKDDLLAARAWLKQNGDPYDQIILDQDGSTAINWGVYGTPETFIVDRHGIIRYRHVGALNQEQWLSTIEPLIKQLEAES